MRKASKTPRLTLSTVVAAVAVGLCLLFWFGAPEWDRSVFGLYSMKWFAGLVIANVVILLLTLAWLRRPGSAGVSGSRRLIKQSVWKRAVFAGMTLLPVLLAIEIGLRYAFFATPPRLFRPVAGATSGYHSLLQHADRTRKNGKHLRAYRGQIYPRSKTTDYRIVCLGGSTTWGHGLKREETWPFILEDRLQGLGYDVEVINAGRSWYTTAHSVTNYALQMRYYNPDVVIVMHGVNDLARSFPAPGEPEPEWDYGSYQGPMRNVLAGYRAHLRKPAATDWHPLRLLSSTAIYRLLFDGIRTCQGPADVDVGIEAFTTLESFREHLAYLTDLCINDKRRVILSTQAHIYNDGPVSLSPETVTLRSTFMQTAEGSPISASSLGMAMRAVRETVIDLTTSPSLFLADVEGAIDGRAELFIDDFHLNAKGAAATAEVFVDVLRPILNELPANTVDTPPLAKR